MDTSTHDLAGLFMQLGLPHTTQDINHFVTQHPLPSGVGLAKAPFWNEAQAAFLAQALVQDSDWAVVCDKLALLLSAPIS